MKSWADHCSSDDDDSDEEAVVPVVQEPPQQPKETDEPEPEPEPELEQEPVKKQKEYILPTRPPFKAFIGNLAFIIKEQEQFGEEITKLCLERLQANIKVVKCNLVQDPNSGKMMGYGYVEVETLEMVSMSHVWGISSLSVVCVY